MVESISTIEGPSRSVTSQTCFSAPDIGLLESKLHPPTPRPGAVARTALLDRLEASTAPIVSVVAPGGYGKTTLLGQWAARCPLSSAWLSLDEHDEEPIVLLDYLVAALERIEPIDPERRRSLLAEAAVDSSWSLRHLAVLLASMRTPFLLVLDHVETVKGERSGDLIAVVALNLPKGSKLALASRAEPPLPRARLRTQGLIEELGRDDLRMAEHEAGELLSGAGAKLGTAEVSELVTHTEGWPVGLYLASLSMKAGGSGTGLARMPDGADRVFADYLRAEVLANLAPSTVALLTRTSILDRLSGPLCDMVTAATGSQEVLESLEESNMLIVPLDFQRRWYRCHHLLGELLRAELERNEPAMVSRLHDRAATWFEANGEPASALDHAQAAGDADRAARLFGQIAQTSHGAGRADTVSRWLSWFSERDLVGRYPHVAVLGVVLEALNGAEASSRLLAHAAATGDVDGPGPDGSPLASWIAFMDACLCRQGVDQMRQDADRSTQQLDRRSPLRGPATVLHGIAALLQGHAAVADSLLRTGAELSLCSGDAASAAVAFAERACLAIDQGDCAAALRLSDVAVTIVRDAHIELYVHASVVYAVAAERQHEQATSSRLAPT